MQNLMLKNVLLCVISCSVTLLAVFIFSDRIMPFLNQKNESLSYVEMNLNSKGQHLIAVEGYQLNETKPELILDLAPNGKEYIWKSNADYPLVLLESKEASGFGGYVKRSFFINLQGRGMVIVSENPGALKNDLSLPTLHEYKIDRNGRVADRHFYAKTMY